MIFVTQTNVTLLFCLRNIYVTISIQQLVVDVNSKIKGGEKMKANKDIRDMVEEKGFCLWELAEALKLSSDSALSRKLRRELSNEEKQLIFKTLDRMVEQRSNKELKKK